MNGNGICIVPAHGCPHEWRYEWYHNNDGVYQKIIRKSDEYSDRLEELELPEEVRLLIDRYVSEQNAHSTCAIDPDMGCSPTCLAFPTVKRCFWKNACLRNRKRCPKKVKSHEKGLEMQSDYHTMYRIMNFVQLK